MATYLALVVDDEPLIRMLIADILRDADFDVLEAEDSLGALEVLETAQVQLLCTDVQMPGDLDGIDLALLVKARHPEVRVIICSGFSPKDARVASVPFLSKPFLCRHLVELAHNELSAAARGPSVAAK
jgi:DNA-binding NtrC family response regulator